MNAIRRLICLGTFSVAAGFSTALFAQNIPVVHWINESGVRGDKVLSTNGVFVTDFKGRNDCKVTPIGTHTVNIDTNVFGGSSPGNNPWYITGFVGASTNGTGDGIAGDTCDLNMTTDTTSTLQFDFQLGLGPQDRLLLIDVDGAEQYQVQAYVLSGGTYSAASVAGWTVVNYSGSTGAFPNANWPAWNPTTGTLVSQDPGGLNQEIVALTPNQRVDRVVVSKLTGGSGQSSDVNFESLALPLSIRTAGTNVVLTWANFPAQSIPVVHWINDAGQRGSDVMNAGGVFLTDFKSHNDFRAVSLTSDTVYPSVDVYGGAHPGNNPSYCTLFTGIGNNGTGDGVAGDIADLEMTTDSTGAVQFDFLTPLTPQDRVLVTDVDGPEQYTLKAYVFDGTNYNQVSMAGWTTTNYSGSTGELPTSQWPVWNGATGSLNSGAMPNTDLNQELCVMMPAQNIDRLQVYKLTGSAWSTEITFASPLIQITPAIYSLQSAPTVTGPYTNIVGATTPYTNIVCDGTTFFRLILN